MSRGWATLRVRTTLLAAAVTAIALVLGAVALVLTLRAQLTVNGDDLARTQVRALLAAAEDGSLRTPIEVGDESVAQVVDDRGTVVAWSANVTGHPPIAEIEGDTELEVVTVDGPDDNETERYRVWMATGDSPDGPVTALVGTSLESVSEATRTLRTTLVVGVPVLLLLLAAGTWVAVGRALRRIDSITDEVDRIGEGDLDRRVPTSPVDDEVSRLAETMNRMLARLEEAAERQRAFVADASHDLQSPLAALRAQLEVAQAHPDRVEVGQLSRDLLDTSASMEALVHDLVYLAAQDHDGSPARLEPVDLDDLVLEEVARLRPVARVSLDTEGVSAAPVLGNGPDLRRLVRNLLDNAVRHAATTVRVSVSTAGDAVLLDVVDDGPGVTPADRDRVFDRFFRRDTARSRGTGSGLGLAIARSVARRHGGDVRLVDSQTGAHFRLRLPQASG